MTTPKEPVEGSIRWMHTIGIGAESCDCDLCLPLQGLPDEFRRLAAESLEASDLWRSPDYYSGLDDGWVSAWERAAQMLEERLNGA